MLGLGTDRLRARPSLLDLIGNRSEDNESVIAGVSSSASSPPAASNNHLPPLPDSPATTSSLHHHHQGQNESYTYKNTSNTPRRQPVSSSSSSSIPTRRPPSSTMAAGKTGEEHGSVFSVSGSVVVAENMIGCAMYELVSLLQSALDIAWGGRRRCWIELTRKVSCWQRTTGRRGHSSGW